MLVISHGGTITGVGLRDSGEGKRSRRNLDGMRPKDKKIEEGYPGQQGNGDAQQSCTHQQNQQEKHEWENHSKCES